MSQRDRSVPSVEAAPHWFFVWPSFSAPTLLSAATGRPWATKPQEVKSSHELQVKGRVRERNGAVGGGGGGGGGGLSAPLTLTSCLRDLQARRFPSSPPLFAHVSDCGQGCSPFGRGRLGGLSLAGLEA